MRLSAHLALVLAAVLIGSPLSAQTAPGQMPSEDQSSRSVAPAPPPERRSLPPFPHFSRTPPKSARTHVAPKPKHIVVRDKQKQAPAHRDKVRLERKAKAEQPRLSSRERKDLRWCKTLNHRQLGRNAKCRKVLDRQKPVAKSAPPLTRQDRKDERRCGNLSLKQVLRDTRCRKVAERQLAGRPSKSTNVSAHHAKAKAITKRSAKSHSTRKRSRR